MSRSRAPALGRARPPWPLRSHQVDALAAVGEAFGAGRRRAWVVLPPGTGKTLVGTETVRTQGVKALVLCPNAAIQSQWCATWERYGAAPAGTERDLSTDVTVLTYQSLAVFESAGEADDDTSDSPPGRSAGAELDRLHPNGRALVDALVGAGPVTLVLDECHHLLEVWGRLLAELLALLPQAHVLGLTATTPDVLDAGQAALVDELFGSVVHAASMPAAVRTGHLAPYAELAWFTEPSAAETTWLSEQSERFDRLVTDLMDPTFGSVPLLPWLDRRIADATVPWSRLERDDPAFCDAVLRLTHAGLLRRPDAARVREHHRHPPTGDDWARLLDDWVRGCLSTSDDPDDAAVLADLARVLPSVGYQLTRHGLRRGRSPVDRVLARSEAKVDGCVAVLDTERRALGDRLRALVVCDHESASATAPGALGEVVSDRAGSARLVLERLVGDERTADLHPVLVTGRTVAAAPDAAGALVAHVRASDPVLADALSLQPWDGTRVVQVTGPWRSRTWVPLVTSFLEAGSTRVLVGTRALLGEGWDARGLSSLVDLSTAASVGAVVQTRGRTVRVDPTWPDKVALTWSIVCLTEAHPRGHTDWDRFVRKHRGYLGVDDVGDVVAGVGHVDADLTPAAPPGVSDLDALNARALVRAEARDELRDRWRVGEPYEDRVVHTLRLVSRRPTRPGSGEVRRTTLGPPPTTLLGTRGVRRAGDGRRDGPWTTVRELASREATPGLAAAVADGLHGAGLTGRGADDVVAVVGPDGSWRLTLDAVSDEDSELFARCLDEVVGPLATPRYVVARYLLGTSPGWSDLRAGWRQLIGRTRPDGVTWHAVPTVLGVNARVLAPFADAWSTWVADARPLFTGSPDGAGVLAAQRGSDPLDVASTMRVQWR